MNLLLFDSPVANLVLSRDDPRAKHLLGVLRRREGDTFDAGVLNGPRGKGRLAHMGDAELTLDFDWAPDPAADAAPITLIVGLPRPQTARDILREATSLGVGALHFVRTEKGEASYAQSKLWSGDEWQRHIRTGAEQAFCTAVPEVTHGESLATAVAMLPAGTRFALDNYESPEALGQIAAVTAPVSLCIGSERGWSAAERDLLRTAEFRFVHLGPRILRTETACIAALTLVRAKLGLL